jgi:hypothetical protein
MRILASFLFIWIASTSPVLAQNAQIGNPAINFPRPGDVLQGVVAITGSDDITGFTAAEVSFTYADDPTGTWFFIALANLPVTNDTVAAWDTTTITDGNYVLRLRVSLQDGSTRETTVSGLRVRNYTPIETPTPTAIVATATVPTATIPTVIVPTPVAPSATFTPTITMTPSPFPTPTRMPDNPAILAPINVYTSILYGGLAVILSFSLFGLYLWLRRK